MKKNDIKIAIDLLNDKADVFKAEIVCLESYLSELKDCYKFFDSCNLDLNYVHCVQSLILQREDDLYSELHLLNLKIESIDVVVGELFNIYEHPSTACIMIEVDDI